MFSLEIEICFHPAPDPDLCAAACGVTQDLSPHFFKFLLAAKPRALHFSLSSCVSCSVYTQKSHAACPGRFCDERTKGCCAAIFCSRPLFPCFPPDHSINMELVRLISMAVLHPTHRDVGRQDVDLNGKSLHGFLLGISMQLFCIQGTRLGQGSRQAHHGLWTELRPRCPPGSQSGKGHRLCRRTHGRTKLFPASLRNLTHFHAQLHRSALDCQQSVRCKPINQAPQA